jgi:hypothetical protein
METRLCGGRTVFGRNNAASRRPVGSRPPGHPPGRLLTPEAMAVPTPSGYETFSDRLARNSRVRPVPLNRSSSWRYVAPTGLTRIATDDSENANPWDFRGIADCDRKQPRTSSWSGSAAQRAEATEPSRGTSRVVVDHRHGACTTFMTSGLHIHRSHDGGNYSSVEGRHYFR